MSLLHTFLLPPFPSSFAKHCSVKMWHNCCCPIIVLSNLIQTLPNHGEPRDPRGHTVQCTYSTCVLCCILSHSYTLVFWDFVSETAALLVLFQYTLFIIAAFYKDLNIKSRILAVKKLCIALLTKNIFWTVNDLLKIASDFDWAWCVYIQHSNFHKNCLPTILALLKIKRKKIEYLLNRLRYCKNF